MTDTIGHRIRTRRKEMRITVDGLGKMVGAHAQTIQKIENNKITQSRYLIPICKALGLDPEAIPRPDSGRGKRSGVREHSLVHELSHFGHFNGGSQAPGSGGYSRRLDLDVVIRVHLPVFSTNYDAVLSEDPVEQKVTPYATVAHAYGLRVATDEMAPAFKAGDTALIDPNQTARPGDDVVLREKSVGGKVVLCELKSADAAAHYTVHLHGKPSRKVEKKIYPIIHRVVGKYSR
jgi:DNA-binding XRE family transcriptional regulator